MEKVIYFVRHGQSEHNVKPVFQWAESPLTELGSQQSEKIATRVAMLQFDALISSPQTRTKDTAEIIARATGKTPEFSELFEEYRNPSRLSGKAKNDKDAAALWLDWERSLFTPGLKVEDGENYDEQMQRVAAALHFLQKREEETIVVVTHGNFLRAMLLRVILDESMTPDNLRHFQSRAEIENTGISVIKRTDIWRFWVYNDHSHLG